MQLDLAAAADPHAHGARVQIADADVALSAHPEGELVGAQPLRLDGAAPGHGDPPERVDPDAVGQGPASDEA
ncbi:MAG: hypothetical protein P8Y02_12345 [Deinococcales bacterium]